MMLHLLIHLGLGAWGLGFLSVTVLRLRGTPVSRIVGRRTADWKENLDWYINCHKQDAGIKPFIGHPEDYAPQIIRRLEQVVLVGFPVVTAGYLAWRLLGRF